MDKGLIAIGAGSVLSLLVCGGAARAQEPVSDIGADEQVVFFPTSAALDRTRDVWLVPIHAWVFEPEADSTGRAAALELFRKSLGLQGSASVVFDRRARPFLVDNERGQQVVIDLLGARHALPESGADGHLETVIEVPVASAADHATDRWVSFRAVLGGGDLRVMEGVVELVDPTGVSVISDIDDTIKISEVHDRQRLLANTFLEPMQPVKGMAELYRHLERAGATFHYVSSSPWQLHDPLHRMMQREGFPTGSFHLKQFRWKDSSFFDLFASADETKPPILEALLKRYPDRRFVLIGDAGELDAEIYGAVARRFPEQVAAIAIRIVEPQQDRPERFQRAFRGVPLERWTVFRDAAELQESRVLSDVVAEATERPSD